jgi:hypothetical protein
MRPAAVAALVLALALPATGAVPRRAALQLETTAPLVVSGRHFGAGESVLLTYAAAGGTSRVIGIRATRTGAFEASFPLRLGRCDSFTVRAAGLRGSRAILQVERGCTTKGPPKRALAGIR